MPSTKFALGCMQSKTPHAACRGFPVVTRLGSRQLRAGKLTEPPSIPQIPCYSQEGKRKVPRATEGGRPCPCPPPPDALVLANSSEQSSSPPPSSGFGCSLILGNSQLGDLGQGKHQKGGTELRGNGESPLEQAGWSMHPKRDEPCEMSTDTPAPSSLPWVPAVSPIHPPKTCKEHPKALSCKAEQDSL